MGAGERIGLVLIIIALVMMIIYGEFYKTLHQWGWDLTLFEISVLIGVIGVLFLVIPGKLREVLND